MAKGERTRMPATLRRLVARGEGPQLEFKRSTGELREAMVTLCGMLNARGEGRVLFGVSDKREVVGQEVSEKTLREIANISRQIEPPVEIQTRQIGLPASRSVLIVQAVARMPGPFTFDGRGYLRVGNTTQRMARTEFDRRVALRLVGEKPWDRWIAPGWKLRDLDRNEIHQTIQDAVQAKRLVGVLGERPELVLRRLELVTHEGMTRAAAILFGREAGPRYPLGEIRLARFRGTTKDEFRDNRQFTGHAFALLRHAERFLDEHVPVASRFVPGKMRRVDTPLYPPLALREALVNALVHRDYSVDGGAVSVALFDDRLEVWSTGTLPEGLTPEKLKGTHESIPRNRLVADVFYRRGLIERWGRGTNKILEEAKKAGCPEPEFEEVAGSFIVQFRPSAGGVITRPAGEGGRAEKVLRILHRSEALTAAAILRELGETITLRALQKELKRLREGGQIVAVGRGKTTRYQVAARG